MTILDGLTAQLAVGTLERVFTRNDIAHKLSDYSDRLKESAKSFVVHIYSSSLEDYLIVL
jgi:hypothetical protein